MDYKKAYEELLLADRVSLRERVVMEVVRIGYQEIDGAIGYAKELVSFIEGGITPVQKPSPWEPMIFALKKKRGVKPGTIRGPYKKRKKPRK